MQLFKVTTPWADRVMNKKKVTVLFYYPLFTHQGVAEIKIAALFTYQDMAIRIYMYLKLK